MSDKTTDDRLFADLVRGAQFTGDWNAVITAYVQEANKGGPSEAFYLTQAYTHALEANDPVRHSLRARLVALKAETPET